MNYYTKFVSFELAKKLKEAGYDKDYGYQYDNDGELVDPASPGGYEGICEAPTYAAVLDWLFERGIFIQLKPGFTFAVVEKMGFNYTICTIDKDEPKLKREHCDDFASFGLCVESAITRALEILKEKDNENN